MAIGPPARAEEGHRKGAVWWVAALTAVALMLRLVRLDHGLWIDEIYSLLRSFRLPLAQIVAVFPGDNHHPLYAVLARLSLMAFGEAPWTLRLPSALFGAATVPLLYALGAQVAGRREGLAAAALLTVSYHHVWFSQNARGYAMLAFFATACTWLLLRLIAPGGRVGWVGYGIAAALGAYTHLTMVFVVVGQAAVCLVLLALPRGMVERRRLWRSLVAGFGLAAVLTVVLYAPVLAQVQDYFANRPSQMRGVSTPGWAALEGLRVLAVGFGGGRLAVGAAALAVGAALFAAGAFSYLRRQPLALGLYFAPAAVTVAGALVARGTMYPRFFFALMGFGLLVWVRGVFVTADALAARSGSTAVAARRGRLLGAMVIGVALVLSAASLPANYRWPKQDFVGALRFVEAHRRRGDAVAAVGVTAVAYRDYLGRDWTPVATGADLARLRAGRRVWLVYAFPRYVEHRTPEVKAVADRECATAAVFRGTVGGGDIVVCRLEPVT